GQLELAGRLAPLGGRAGLWRGAGVEAQLELDLVAAALLQRDAAVGGVLQVDAALGRPRAGQLAEADLVVLVAGLERLALRTAHFQRRGLALSGGGQLEVLAAVRLSLLGGGVGALARLGPLGPLGRRLVHVDVGLRQLERRGRREVERVGPRPDLAL